MRNDSFAKNTLDLSYESLRQQIKSIQETQKEFDIQNTPFLECKKFRVENVAANQRPVTTFGIYLYSQQAQKILKIQFGSLISSNPVNPDVATMKSILRNIQSESRYITRDDPIYIKNETPSVINSSIASHLLLGEWFFYMYGEIAYENEVSKKKRLHTFYIKFNRIDRRLYGDSRQKRGPEKLKYLSLGEVHRYNLLRPLCH
ncbi:MAG TPA: hypothetical protein VGP55_03715 [Chitinophagaceae bacterium]|nr:hypothetical protein [Chitinophagaceae bacterium]